jgi:tetratricopeptide (TPR) repeat protein
VSDSIADRLRALYRNNDMSAVDRLVAEQPALEETTDPRLRLVLATVAAIKRDGQRLQRYAEGLEETQFTTPDDLADFALVSMARGAPDTAEAILKRLAAAPDADGFVHARLGALQIFKGEFDEAAANLQAALRQLPDRPEILSNLGGIRLRQNRLDAALEYYDRALNIDPKFAVAKEQRGRVQVALGRQSEALEEREAELERNPDDVNAHISLASLQMQLERYEEAEATLENALQRFPDDAAPRRLFVQLLFTRRQWAKVGYRLLQWHEADPEDYEIRAQLNRARLEAGFLDTAEADLDAWPADQKAGPIYPMLRARLLSERQRQAEAVDLLEQALETFPGLNEARQQLTLALNQLGRIEEAQHHERILAQTAPAAAIGVLAKSQEKLSDTQLGFLGNILENPSLSREQRANAGFALAQAHDRRKEYDAAFAALASANDLIHQGLSYDWRWHRRQVQQSMTVFTRTRVADLADAGHPSSRPIFVCGMPRSGTTLVEQILASHPKVYGAGELSIVPRITRLMPKVIGRQVPYPTALRHLTRQQIYDAGMYYLNRVARIESESDHVVDKLPHNFDHAGLIALMLPNAKIVHLQRDPRDVAVSNYYQNFAAKDGLMGFAFDLGDIGHMLNDHDRIMDHWRELFPERIYDQSYEALVRDPETEIAKLLDHCGLPWDDRVMRFYETQRPVKTASIRQVREGIYTTSAEKWRRYERHLGPLEEVLAEGFQPVGPPQGDTAAPAYADAGTTAAGETATFTENPGDRIE